MVTAPPCTLATSQRAQRGCPSYSNLPPLNNCLAFIELFPLNTALKIAAWLLRKALWLAGLEFPGAAQRGHSARSPLRPPSQASTARPWPFLLPANPTLCTGQRVWC